MEPNFQALQVIAEVALGIVGFSAILIGLSRTSDGFSAPDNFRIQLLTYSAFSAVFCALLPFAIYTDSNPELSWSIVSWVICIVSVMGLLIFPRRMLGLRNEGYEKLFPIHIFLFQTAILSVIFIISGLMILGYIKAKANFYVICLMLFLVQSSFAFIRTMFVRIK
tara:strand:- start:9986 stop:10483 length:498 start_codon:yes stop_codon:yes gene_type:complete